ncbi:protein PUTATIVE RECOMBINATION INITIATION DEFECT 1 [Cornus florida]|uniref:protein PUTATIVE RECOMBINATION INITIATION DEFECT 1 n=1 Tax=Cornus florida TaxID=4283 RepID=UPI002899D81C|nr:protein PUTATIVE RECOMBINATION INITIATION DEFECT 1 [Cornus florida]
MMYFNESDRRQEFESERYSYTPHQSSSPKCAQGHRSSLMLQTLEGGSICLVCFSNLISNPSSPTIHVSYALSQLSQAISQPPFLQSLLTFHAHFLVSPLVNVLSEFDDEPIARQATDLISELSNSCDSSVCGDFVSRIADRLSSGALAWSRRQVYTLHCLGILLDFQKNNPFAHIKYKDALIFNLVTGLQLPSEEIQGEILFLLYKISILQHANMDDDVTDVLFASCPKLLRLSLEVLTKTQSDDVRLNSIALLTVLAQRGFFENARANDMSSKNSCEADNFMQTTEHVIDGSPLNILFAEAIKAPLLSSDSQVQLGTLDLIFLYLSWEGGSEKEIQVMVEENIADYVFEILRLSGCKDPVVNSCLQVLDLLSTSEQAFRHRLAIGFTTLVPVLRYVAEVPFHPAQTQALKLIWSCVSNCPGIVSTSHIEELSLILTGMLKKHIDGEIGMHPDTFTTACSILVALMKSPSSHGSSNFLTAVRDATTNAVLTCLSLYRKHPSQLLHSLYLLKEAYAYSHEGNFSNSCDVELKNCILDVCKTHLLPWFKTAISEMEEEDIVLGVLETFHSILLQDSDNQATEFARILVSSSWFSFSFGCLGLFPTEKMKWRVYLMFSSIVDLLLGNCSGQPIRDAASHMPSDPIDMMFLLGQKSSHNLELFSCQSAILLILYSSSLYDDRLADEKLMLASLEQYILINNGEFLYGAADTVKIELLVNLYSLSRGLAKMSYQMPYSLEAERILFHLVTEKECDLLSTRIHWTSLKWLFQQEKICKPLSNQILKLCRCNCSDGYHIVIHGSNSQNIDVRAIAQLVASGDNFAATLLVCLLKELIEEGQEHDIISVVNTLSAIIDILPAASDQLCLHGIGSAFQNLYHHSRHYSSPQRFMVISQLIFRIIHSVRSESLCDDEAWLVVTMKLMDYLSPTVAADTWTEEALVVVGILSLILYHSTNQALVEASKTILLSSPLISAVNNAIHVACSKGPALVDHDEETKTGETLIFVLLLHFFSLRSVHAILPGSLDWQNYFDQANGKQPLSFISIHYHDLCRLVHFGSPVVKLVASCCLLELFTRISDQKNRIPVMSKSTTGNLLSVMAVLEGQLFCSDIKLALSCGFCLSKILGWEKLDTEAQVVKRNNWFRLIVEELAMSLAAPCLGSKSFMIHHSPAVSVAVALLKLQKVPAWMSSVFDDSCISGIIENLSVSNVNADIVILFRELLNSGYLKSQQIASLNHIFQACRKRIYMDDTQNATKKENTEKVIAIPDNLGNVCELLIGLVLSQSSLVMDSKGSKIRNKRLLEEIEVFSRSLMEEDDG